MTEENDADKESRSLDAGDRRYLGSANSASGYGRDGGTWYGAGGADREFHSSSLRSRRTTQSRVSSVGYYAVIALYFGFIIFNNLTVLSEENQAFRWRLERIAAWLRYFGEYALWIGRKTWT